MGIKDYFAFTRGEKSGALVLLFVIVILIGLNIFSDLFFSKKEHPNFSEFENEINQFEKEISTNQNSFNQKIELFEFNPNTISDSDWARLGFKEWQIKTINNYKSKGGSWKTKNDVAKIYGLDNSHFVQLKPHILLPDKIDNEHLKKDSEKDYQKPTYFNFNPNTITKLEWKKLGFKDWQIKSIFKYKSKGGSWKTKSDVAKIYGLSNEDYQKLAPFILLPEDIEKTTKSSHKDFSKKVNINTANTKELTNLKGIYSEKYAAIIVKYRTSLGGFISKEQLLEVWNMKEDTYNGFLKQVELGSSDPKQININTATADNLKSHPYINWNTANAIVKYRKANGNFKSVTDIKKIHLISEEIYHKIAPYLKTN